jgi:CRP-like cAMP-binding protein
MINYITNYINKPVLNRVITQLLNEANYLINFKLINEQDLTFKIRRNDLAALVGASRENIILALNKLKKMDLIDSNGSFIKIKNLQTLIELNES